MRTAPDIAFRTAWVITRLRGRRGGGRPGRLREGAPRAGPLPRRARRCGPGCSTIVANEARNRVRAAGRRERLVLRVAEERRPDGAVPSPEAALLDSERRDELLAAIERLPETGRARRSPAATSSTCPRRRRRRRSAARAAPSSRALSRALERLRAELDGGGGDDRARAELTAARPRARLAGDAGPGAAAAARSALRACPRRLAAGSAPAGLRRSLALAFVGAAPARRRRLRRGSGRARRRARLLRPPGRHGRAPRAAAAGAAAAAARRSAQRTTLAARARRARLRAARARRRRASRTRVFVRRQRAGRRAVARRTGRAPGLPEAPAAPGSALLVDEFRGDLSPEYAGKIAGQATTVERLTRGRRAARSGSPGAPHFFFYRAPGQPFRERALRIAQNVLLLEHGRLLVRLEGAFGRSARDRAGPLAALAPLSSRRLQRDRVPEQREQRARPAPATIATVVAP